MQRINPPLLDHAITLIDTRWSIFERLFWSLSDYFHLNKIKSCFTFLFKQSARKLNRKFCLSLFPISFGCWSNPRADALIILKNLRILKRASTRKFDKIITPWMYLNLMVFRNRNSVLIPCFSCSVTNQEVNKHVIENAIYLVASNSNKTSQINTCCTELFIFFFNHNFWR